MFRKLVKVNLPSAPGRRESADERPLHHLNRIPLNQRGCHGFGMVKPKPVRPL